MAIFIIQVTLLFSILKIQQFLFVKKSDHSDPTQAISQAHTEHSKVTK